MTTGISRGSAFSQFFKPADPGEVEVVGRLVEQQHVGLGHQHAGKHGKPLPAAAQMFQRPLPQRLGHPSDSSATSTRQLSLSRWSAESISSTAAWNGRSIRASGTSCST